MIYGKGGIVGSGSLMNSAWYLKKMEQTCIYEDPDQMNNYFRSSLKDMRPDRPSLESDQPRTNNYSSDRLNLRHYGARVPDTPDLPDGTFLDFEGLNKDPRGANALDPDMKQFRKQQESRTKFMNYYSDADNSVPSGGRNQAQVIKDIKKQFYNVKNRLKIFDESLGGFAAGTGANQKKTTTSAECMQETDERTPELRDEMCYPRANRINDLSNNTSIGWRRTTDNRFQVAKYGHIRTSQSKNQQNYVKNRSNTFVEHDTLVSWKGQTIPKSLGLAMIDLSKKKYNDMEVGQDILLSESHQALMSRKRRLLPSDIITSKNDTQESQEQTANMLLNGEQSSHLSGRSMQPILDSNRVEKVVVDPIIVNYMASVNKKMSPREMNDLRTAILQSAEFTGILLDRTNKKSGSENYNNELFWQSIANYDKGTSMKIVNYKQLQKQSTRKKNDYDYEEYKKDQKTAMQKSSVLKPSELYNMDILEYDQKVEDEIVGTKLIGGLGTKRMRSYIDNGDIRYDTLTDMSATCRPTLKH
jgi:hypothetical protein